MIDAHAGGLGVLAGDTARSSADLRLPIVFVKKEGAKRYEFDGHRMTEKDSLALKFLSLGTLGVVASTCISYGSITTPLIAADLLGQLFWREIKFGRTAGEALMQAKVDLVREMNRRQGYLDGEDQKTLISFILYGHTHTPDQKALEVLGMPPEERDCLYLNTGTWRPSHSQGATHRGFISWKNLTCRI